MSGNCRFLSVRRRSEFVLSAGALAWCGFVSSCVMVSPRQVPLRLRSELQAVACPPVGIPSGVDIVSKVDFFRVAREDGTDPRLFSEFSEARSFLESHPGYRHVESFSAPGSKTIEIYAAAVSRRPGTVMFPIPGGAWAVTFEDPVVYSTIVIRREVILQKVRMPIEEANVCALREMGMMPQ